MSALATFRGPGFYEIRSKSGPRIIYADRLCDVGTDSVVRVCMSSTDRARATGAYCLPQSRFERRILHWHGRVAPLAPVDENAVAGAYDALALINLCILAADQLRDDAPAPSNQLAGDLLRSLRLILSQVERALDQLEKARLQAAA
jgi:hypothetical protein